MGNKNYIYSVGGLCSGIGGIELGFKQSGFTISWANDMDKYAMYTYKELIGENHYIDNKPLKIEDILLNDDLLTKISYVDVLASGFPCQSFSLAGNKKGFGDSRGTVFFKICELITFLQEKFSPPKVIFLENVKNFRSHDNGNTFKTVKNHLENLGYSVYTKILNTSEMTGIPQNRERTFLVCFYGEHMWKNFQFDQKESDADLFSELNEKEAKKKCPKTYLFHNNMREYKKIKKKSIDSFLIDHDKVDKKYFINERYERLFQTCIDQIDDNKTFYQYRRGKMRKNKNNNCPTLMANMGAGGHNVPIVLIDKKKKLYRKLMPLECFYFQGFSNISLPSGVSDTQLYKQAGNSVTVPIITKLASFIKFSLSVNNF